MKNTFVYTLLVGAFLLLITPSASAASISAMTDQIIYAVNDALTITGSIDTASAANLTATFYNGSSVIMNTTVTESSGGSPNTFSLTNTINSSYAPGYYFMLLTDGTDSVNMTFRVVTEHLILESFLINSTGDVISVGTTVTIDEGNLFYSNGNFTDLINLSISKKLHYNNYSIGGKLYHFVLVDQTTNNTYDRLYIDDETNFTLFDDTEDTEDIEYQELRKGSVFSNGTFKYVVAGMEWSTGDKLILFKPAEGKPPYAPTDTVNVMVIAKNSTHLLSNKDVSMQIQYPNGSSVTSLTSHTTNSFGWFNTSKTLTSVPAGTYVLNLNESLHIIPFPVEAFRLFVTTTDLSNNPTSVFAPDSQVRVSVTARNDSGSIDPNSFTVTVYYPNATTVTLTKSAFEQVSAGVYRYDMNLVGAPTGSYSISTTASSGSDTQVSSTGFEIRSVNFESMAINPKYIDEAEDAGGIMINAFPPNSSAYNSTVTIMTLLLNISAGGMGDKGPEMEGLIPVSDCNSSVMLTEVQDENGVSYLESITYQVMNLSDAIAYFEQTPSDIPAQLLGQCMILFPAFNKTGIYKAEAKINYQGEEQYAGTIFGIQRLFARGETVDSKGDEFGFFAPNTTVRIKLKVRDLVTDEELPGANITSGKIIELERLYPEFKDVLGNATLRENLNESITNGTINFTSPLDEGFYSMKFRFTADVDGQSETGIGDAFFMLKKYMVWGEMSGLEQGQWYISEGENITLTVIVLDIDKAKSYFDGYSTQMTCTGCGNFTVGVSEIRNDQQFETATGYTVQQGFISNSTNPVTTVTIIPSPDMKTGWYSIDLLVNDTSSDSTYFGWGWFEIRNFWVEARKAYYNDTQDFYWYLEEFDHGAAFPIGDPVYFVVLPRNASNPSQLLDPDTISVESVSSFAYWPPIPVTGYTSSISSETTKVCFDEEDPESCVNLGNRYIVNLSGLPEEDEDYQANVKIEVGELSDVGSFWFSTSHYKIEMEYRSKSWPSLFASTENLTVNFTALDFDKNPYNITNVTIDRIFDKKNDRPVRMKWGDNYTTTCPQDNFCQTKVNLSYLSSGDYMIEFEVTDWQDDDKREEIFFRVQDMIVSVPSIEEAWVWETESISKKIEHDVRRGEWTWCDNERDSIPDAVKLCGDFCMPENPCVEFNMTAPNVSYSKEVFGYMPLMEEWAIGEFGPVTNKSRMWMYSNGSHLWINATPDFMGPNWPDLRNTTPITTSETFTDDQGGIWRLDAIGDQSITVTGLNVVYRIGVLINTSYTQSGILKFGQIREEDLGAFTHEGRTGIDLDGDGLTDGTVYFAIADNTTSGVYDMFFFSTDGNFTGNASPTLLNPIDVNAQSRTNRIFGFGDDVTLLSIDARAHGAKFYSQEIGDWAHMGDIKLDSNITIPVIVTAPDGTPKSANVSITGYKDVRTWVYTAKDLVTDQNVTGIAELTFNSSELSGTGEYAFEIKTDEVMEEWKWPMATVRGFFVDGELGEALYLTNFKELDIRTYRWDSPGVDITRIQRDARNNTPGYIFDGVLVNAGDFNFMEENCQVHNATGNMTDYVYSQMNSVYSFMKDHSPNDNGFFFYNLTSQSLYRNETVCWFNVSTGTTYQKGDYITMEKEGIKYNTTILNIDWDVFNYWNETENDIYFDNTSDCHNFNHQPVIAVFDVSNDENGTVPQNSFNWTDTTLCINDTNWVPAIYNISYQWEGRSWRANFGIAGVNASIVEPMVDNPYGDPQWSIEWGYMQNVSIFGTYYDVILANDTTYNYTRCILEPPQDGQCAKKAWIVLTTDGNFSSSQVKNVTIGQNFTSDLYLAGVGPYDGDGITVGNFSNIASLGLSQLPGIGDIPLADNTISRFVMLDEETLGVDLDKNSTANTTFYMLAFDSDFNGKQNLTSVLVDDDLEMVTWSVRIQGVEVPIDFSGNEYFEGTDANWTEEQWCGLPTGIYTGCARFGRDYENRTWEEQPHWDIPFYNITHMLLRKNMWQVNETQQISALLNIYNFDLTAIQGANVSVAQMAVAIPWLGFDILTPGTNYSVDTSYNVSDSYGYSLLQITPNPGTTQEWAEGEYQVLLTIETAQGTENWERWFCAGGCQW